ncbi:MAG: ethylbenzene dehydrogenase [Denitrovibrio sp.]|nr:MAG: ethylbenzene dehydrogenase [Denitrovibrio sp.]
MRKLGLFISISAMMFAVSAFAADMTLYSVKTSSKILLDGQAEKAWSKAKAISIELGDTPYEPSNGYEGMTETVVKVKSLYDDKNIYFLVQYADPTKSLERFPWIKQKDGSWKKMANKDSTGHDNTYYEDKLAFFWDINTKGFADEGCMVSCHMGIEGDKSAGRKFTNAPGETIDMWHAKYVRTLPLGMFDDQYMDSNKDPKKNKSYGRKGDDKKGGGYANNDNADKTAPAFMNLNGADSDKYFVIPSKKVPFVDNFSAGDVVPGIVITPFSGQRGDILARNYYADGMWTLELQRALVTKGKNVKQQDVQFSDLNKAYPFGMSVFDNSQINHLFHTDTLELKFK